MLRKDIIRPARVAQGTADPAEIARFDALADEWWKPDGKFKVVHGFNAARVGLIKAVLTTLAVSIDADKPLTGLHVADIGCGVGIVPEPLTRAGARVTAIDASAQNIAIATRHASQSGLDIDYRCALPEDLAAEAGHFDAVLSLEVVEHVADVGLFLDATSALVRPGGLLIIGTINRTPRAWALAIVAAERVLGWLPRGTHDWNKFVRPQETAAHLARHGFRQRALHGVVLDPLTWRWRASRDTAVNYLQVFTRAAS